MAFLVQEKVGETFATLLRHAEARAASGRNTACPGTWPTSSSFPLSASCCMSENAEVPACTGYSYSYLECHDQVRQLDYGSRAVRHATLSHPGCDAASGDVPPSLCSDGRSSGVTACTLQRMHACLVSWFLALLVVSRMAGGLFLLLDMCVLTRI